MTRRKIASPLGVIATLDNKKGSLIPRVKSWPPQKEFRGMSDHFAYHSRLPSIRDAREITYATVGSVEKSRVVIIGSGMIM